MNSHVRGTTTRDESRRCDSEERPSFLRSRRYPRTEDTSNTLMLKEIFLVSGVFSWTIKKVLSTMYNRMFYVCDMGRLHSRL